MTKDTEQPAEGLHLAQNPRLVESVFWAVSCAVVLLTWPTWAGLVKVWNHQFGYSHGFLVAPLSGWLAWRALRSGSGGPITPFPLALILMVPMAFLWLFLRLATVRTLEQALVVALLWTAVTAVLGWAWGRVLLFPLGFFLFAVPVWEVLRPVLQRMTSTAAAVLCEGIGIPTYLDGQFVHIPNGVFSISQGCSGNHYFLSSITLAALYGYLEYRGCRPRLVLVILAAALAIVSNWLRVVVVIYAGHATGMHHPWVKDHNMVGWAIFTAGLVPLFFVAQRLERAGQGAPAPAAATARGASTRRITVVFIAAAAALALPSGVRWIAESRGDPVADHLLPAPVIDEGWSGPQAPDVDWIPAFPSADKKLRLAYEKGDVRVTLFEAVYLAQEDGKEVISYDNRIEGLESWTVVADLSEPDDTIGPWRRALLAGSDGRRRIVLYRYALGGRSTTSPLTAKIWQGLGGFTGNRGASILAVSTACKASCDDSIHDLRAFVNALSLGG